MLIGIMGENCSGKSALAEALRDALGAELVTGRDYLRLAKSESMALALFRKRLSAAVTGEDLIYVIAERELLKLLPEGAVRILVSADLDTVKARFRARMRGNLPEPVERMLERNHGCFDAEPCDYRYDGVGGDPAQLAELLKQRKAAR